MNPHFHTDFSISDSLIFVRKSVLIYETIIERGKKSSKNKEKKLYFASKNIHKVASFIMLKSNSRKSRKVIRR